MGNRFRAYSCEFDSSINFQANGIAIQGYTTQFTFFLIVGPISSY